MPENKKTLTFNAGSATGLYVAVTTLIALTTLALLLFPEWVASPSAARLFGTGAALFLALYISCARTSAQMDVSKTVVGLTTIVWAFLLISEEIFGRSEEVELEEHFSSGVYSEISFWVLSVGIILFLLIKARHPLSSFFAGQSKWLFAFGALCAVSAVYSSHVAYSVAWALKLILVLLVLRVCSSAVRDEPDLLTFFKVTFWAFTFVMMYGIDPPSWARNGRLGASPTSLSEVSGIVLILSFGVQSLNRKVWPLIVSVLASLIMLLSGGKAGILGGVFSVGLFFLLKKKPGSAVILSLALITLGVVLVVSTPLGSYAEAYTEADQGDNLTGRTDLWRGALPLIRQSPILGHGYVSSKYISLEVEDVHWEAGHLHNAFLDVLYNNGIVGLLLILYMHVVIIKSLLRLIRQHGTPRVPHEVAVAFLAIYLNLLISSCFNSTIGGRPSYFFMMFLAIFVMSEKLTAVSRRSSLAYASGSTDSSPMFVGTGAVNMA